MPDLSLNDDDHGTFTLTSTSPTGEAQTTILSEDDVLRLGQSALHLMQQIAAKRSRPGADMVVMTPVAQVEVNTDHHQTELHLTMIDGRGARIGFSLALEVARPLADALPRWVAKIEAAAKKVTRQ